MTDNLKNYIAAQFKDVEGEMQKYTLNWVEQFAEFLNNHVTDEEVSKKLIKHLVSKENLMKMDKSNFSKDIKNLDPKKDFFNYLSSIEDELSFEYCEKAYEYILENIDSCNIIDLFIRYLIVTRFEDLSFKGDISGLVSGYIGDDTLLNCCLGDFIVGQVDVGIPNIIEGNNICFDNFHTRRGMTGLKIGSVLFKELARQVHEYYPDKYLFAIRIKKENVKAINFYKKRGGVFEAYTMRELAVSYDPATVEKISNEVITPPKFSTGDNKVNKKIQ